MKKFLSIDWDYFIEATAEERFEMFPDGGNENLPSAVKSIVWNSLYANSFYLGDKTLTGMTVYKEGYKKLITFLQSYSGFSVCTESHKHSYDHILRMTKPNEEFEVVNIDFHHDKYSYRNADCPVNCGNWVSELQEERPNMKYVWVNREDSEIENLGGSVGFISRTLEEAFKDTYSLVHLCRSDMWSPPHLDPLFQECLDILRSHLSIIEQDEDMEPREYVTIPV